MYGGMPYGGPTEPDNKPASNAVKKAFKYPEKVRLAMYAEMVALDDRKRAFAAGKEGVEGLSEKEVKHLIFLKEAYEETV